MSGRRVGVLLLIGVLLLPVGLVGLYMARGGSGAGPRPMVVPRASAETLPQPMQWVEGLGDAAVERDPHTSMATLEAFVAERVSAKVTELGEDTPVRFTADGPAAAMADGLRERLGTRWGALLSDDAPSDLVGSAASPAEPGIAPPVAPPAPPPVAPAVAAGNAPPAAGPVPYLVDSPVEPVEPHAVSPVEPPRAARVPAPVPSPVTAVGPERPAVPGETTVAVSWRKLNHAAVPWWPTAVKSGELVVYIAGPRGDATVLAKLDEKPWLSTSPAAAGLPDYAVVSVGEPVTSAGEAAELVRRLSVDTLVRRLDARASSMPGGARVPDGELRRQAEQAVIGGGAVVDQCVVRVQRPYGEVFYAANLLDTRPDRIEPLARAAVVNQQSHQRTVAGVLVALPGMMLVLGVVYLGLNALTRGYFRTHLRAAALTVIAVGVVIGILVVMG